MQVWKLPQSLDFMEFLMTTAFFLKGYSNTNTHSSSEVHDTLNNFQNESTQMSWVLAKRAIHQDTEIPI